MFRFIPIFMKQPATSFMVMLSVYLRSAVYMTGQIASTLLLGPVMLVLRPFPFDRRYAAANLWVRFKPLVERNSR